MNPNKTVLNHCDVLVTQFRTLVGSENLSDVRMIVGPHRKVFPAHSVFLSARSTQLHRMLFPEGASKMQRDIEILAADPVTFPSFLEYLYTGCVEITTQNSIHLLYLAKKFNIQELKDACVEIVQSHLSSDNVLQILEVSTMYEESLLVQRCLELVDQHTLTILTQPSFTELELKTVISIIKRETINIDEIQLFACCLQWAREQAKRASHVSPLASDSLSSSLLSHPSVINSVLLSSPHSSQSIFSSTSHRASNTAAASISNLVISNGQRESDAVRREMQHLIPYIRFPLVGSKDLVNIIKPTGCIPEQIYIESLEFNIDPARFNRNEIRFQPRKGQSPKL